MEESINKKFILNQIAVKNILIIIHLIYMKKKEDILNPFMLAVPKSIVDVKS